MKKKRIISAVLVLSILCSIFTLGVTSASAVSKPTLYTPQISKADNTCSGVTPEPHVTIRHEYAHYANFILYRGTGHDRMWRKCCSEVGAVATRCYSGIFNEFFNQKSSERKSHSSCNAYKVGSIIRHPIYGTGTVVSVSGNDINKILETEFYSVGIKRLTAKWVSENC